MNERNILYILSLLLLAGICVAAYYVDSRLSQAKSIAKPKAFISFRNNYLFIYALVMAADWLQGPYIYKLYKSYGYSLDDIALLFICGFLSSAVFGTFVGSLADKFGRRLGCLLFCVLYFLSCVTKFFPNFQILLLGRLLGGVSTSLLFTVFEAWMVSQHNSRGFESEWLSDTFAWCTLLNGGVAILAGVISNITVDYIHLVSPFFLSGVLLVFALVVIVKSWPENYHAKTESANSSNNFESLLDSAKVVYNDFNIFATGTMQYAFEASMYTFVFMWSPVLETAAGSSVLIPFGIIFSAFMVSIMIGSVIFKFLTSQSVPLAKIANGVFLVSSASFMICAFFENELLIYVAFNVFELCCGLYFPTIGMIRSRYVPESIRSTVMNIFRVPLNVIVVIVLLKVEHLPKFIVFTLCAMMNMVALYYSTKVGTQVQKYQMAETSTVIRSVQEAEEEDEEP